MDALNRPFRRDRSVALAYVFNSSLTGFQVALGAVMPVLRSDLGIGLTLASFHFTVASVCSMIGASWTAQVVARFGRRRTMWTALCVVSAALALFCVAPSVGFTLVAAAVLGSGGPFALVLTQAELLDRHPAHRAAAMAELNLVVSAALVITILGVGPLVAVTGSWRIALMLPVIGVLAAFGPLRGLQFSDRDRPRGPATKRQMSRTAWLFCLLIVCSTGFEWSYGYQGAEFLDRAGDVSKETAATLMTLYYLGTVIGRIGLIRAALKFPADRLLIASFGIALAGFVLLAGGPIREIKALGLLVSGFGISMAYPLIVTMAGAMFADATDWIVARLYVAGGLAIAVAPFVIGALGDQIGVARSFWTLGLVILIGLALLSVVGRVQDQPAHLSVGNG